MRCVNMSMNIYFRCQALSGSGSPLEMFSVRGDGLTKATTDKIDVSAFVATASVASYVGTVMEVQTTGTTAGSGFKLFHVGGERAGCGGAVVAMVVWVVCVCWWWVVERGLFG